MSDTVARKLRRSGDTARWVRRQEQILDAAVQLFAEHGYSDTDKQLLAEKLKVGKGTLLERISEVMSNLLYGTMFTNYFTDQRHSVDAQARDILDIVFNGILSDSERLRRGVNRLKL